jgi:hypothetical protein
VYSSGEIVVGVVIGFPFLEEEGTISGPYIYFYHQLEVFWYGQA